MTLVVKSKAKLSVGLGVAVSLADVPAAVQLVVAVDRQAVGKACDQCLSPCLHGCDGFALQGGSVRL